jgi:hypothetical protein
MKSRESAKVHQARVNTFKDFGIGDEKQAAIVKDMHTKWSKETANYKI